MTQLAQLNAQCRRLAKDESGVVLAFTVIVFLSLFVIACSVYAVGENIRQRIELQNAADAAAYSGAVVQADAISRVAAINKALAWTHVQMGRTVMDYDVDVWLQAIITKWNVDYAACLAKILPYSACYLTFQKSWIGSDCGWYTSCSSGGKIQINKNKNYTINEIRSSWHASAPSLQSKINNYRASIKQMNAEEARIVSVLQSRIFSTVTNILQANAGDRSFDGHYYLSVVNPASDYFTTLNDEGCLLNYFTPQKSAKDVFQEGINVWFNLLGGTGIQRGYQQQANSLRADWKWHLEGWVWTKWGPRRRFSQNGSDKVLGSDVLHDANYYQTERVKAQILTPDFFGPKGAIVVSVARRMDNPLLFMVELPNKPGIYQFFDPRSSSKATPYTWATAAARAGYHKDGGGRDEYWTPDVSRHSGEANSWLNSAANLSQADWDAELIPVPWTGNTVQPLWNSPNWKPLSGSGSANMNKGTAPNGNFLH
jgi:Na+-transporting methylmalonyl-CoA/oxaloacetate decarboxylase gamma subunit